MARIVLGVTGSVAAVKTPTLFTALGALGHEVRIVATEPALYFFDPTELGLPSPIGQSITTGGVLFRDQDEWPAPRYKRGDPVLHIEFRNWAELLIIAPLDANTLAKFALGLCDNLLTCLYRAWDSSRPVILAPAMNTLMWQRALTCRHLGQILIDHGTVDALPSDFNLENAPDYFARHAANMILIPPQSKRLACGDMGMGAMAEVTTIAEVVRGWSENLVEPG
jgi:phosphopantothenoylcysteine decarboxylase